MYWLAMCLLYAKTFMCVKTFLKNISDTYPKRYFDGKNKTEATYIIGRTATATAKIIAISLRLNSPNISFTAKTLPVTFGSSAQTSPKN